MTERPTCNQIRAASDNGFAICGRCGTEHPTAGQQHLRSPWRITPRCIDCGEPLLLPRRAEKAA